MDKGSELVSMKLPSENLLLRSSYIFTDSTGKDSIYLLLGEQKKGKLSYSLVGFDTEGTLLEEAALQDTGLPGDYPYAFIRLQDENFAGITKKVFFVADAKGETLFSYAVSKDYSQNNLKELIWEELEPFFENQKDADTVCGIIQSRVQLYLDEHGVK